MPLRAGSTGSIQLLYNPYLQRSVIGDGERHRTIAACPTWQTPLFPYAVKFRLPTLLHSNEASLTATCGPIASTTCCQPRDIIRYGLDEEDKLTVAPVSIVAYVSSLLPWTARHYSSVLDFCALAKTVAGPVATTRSGAVPQDGSGSSKKRQKGQKGRKGAKRQRQEGSDDEGQGDNGNGKSGADSGYDDDEACQGPLWACPFYKFDRRRYYRCVEKVKLNRYSDIKGHINRCHTLNNFFYCQNCWRLWKLDWVNRPSYEAHVQRGDCQAQLGPERLLDAESTSFFSSSAPAGDSTESKWYWIWDQLFPGHPHPESPYVETGIAEPTGILRRDGEASLQARLLGVLARHGIQLHPSQVQGLASDLMEAAIGTPPTPPRLYRLYPNNAADGPVVPNRADTQGLEAIYDEAGPIDTAFDFDGYSNFDVFSQSAAVAGFNFGADNMVMTVPMPPPPPPPPGTVTPAHLRNLGQPQAPEDPSAAGPAAQRQRQAGAAG